MNSDKLKENTIFIGKILNSDIVHGKAGEVDAEKEFSVRH